MGKIVKSINSILTTKGATGDAVTLCDGVIKLAKAVDDVDIPTSILTTGAALKFWAEAISGTCQTTVVIKDSVSGAVVTEATVVLKKGTTVGSGDAVTAVSDKYPLKEGGYNYSVTKTGYITKTGTFSITDAQIVSGSLTVQISLVADPAE